MGRESIAPMAGLNNNHCRFLRVSCQHIDKQLASIEAMLENPAGTAFPRYVDDLAPTQKRVIRDYISRIRERLLALLEQFRWELTRILAMLQKALISAGEVTEAASLPELFGLPITDLGPLRISPSPAPLAILAWSAPLWRRAMQKRAQEALSEPLHAVLRLHAHRLQDWATAAVAHLAESYQERESLYREAIRQPSRVYNAAASPDESGLRHDLQALDQLLSGRGQASGQEALVPELAAS